MAEKKECRGYQFIKNHIVVLLAVCFVFFLAVYFINVIFIQNEETVVSVLVLEFMEDSFRLEQQVRETVQAEEDQKVEIRTIASQVEANKAIVLTWIRAQTVDVIIGEEEQIAEYAQAGYLKELEKGQSDDFLCARAEYNSEGNIIGTGEEECFGKYTADIPGTEFQKPVAGLAENAPHRENALLLLQSLRETS